MQNAALNFFTKTFCFLPIKILLKNKAALFRLQNLIFNYKLFFFFFLLFLFFR